MRSTDHDASRSEESKNANLDLHCAPGSFELLAKVLSLDRVEDLLEEGCPVQPHLGLPVLCRVDVPSQRGPLGSDRLTVDVLLHGYRCHQANCCLHGRILLAFLVNTLVEACADDVASWDEQKATCWHEERA